MLAWCRKKCYKQWFRLCLKSGNRKYQTRQKSTKTTTILFYLFFPKFQNHVKYFLSYHNSIDIIPCFLNWIIAAGKLEALLLNDNWLIFSLLWWQNVELASKKLSFSKANILFVKNYTSEQGLYEPVNQLILKVVMVSFFEVFDALVCEKGHSAAEHDGTNERRKMDLDCTQIILPI